MRLGRFTLRALILVAAPFAVFAASCGDSSDSTSATTTIASSSGSSATASLAPTTTTAPAAEITIAAASDLRPAFGELGDLFTKATGTKVTFSFGSSGQLKEQIVNGAPFDLFASADVGFVDEVIKAGRGRADTKADYAFGRIVLWSADKAILLARIEDVAATTYRRVAIANPKHAPYGLAAKQALEKAGVYSQISSRLVYGENISETFQIAKSGNADVGIVALSLAIADGSRYTLIPEALHNPLQQALVVTGTGARGNSAAAFAKFINGADGRKVMTRYGFTLPGEQVAN